MQFRICRGIAVSVLVCGMSGVFFCSRVWAAPSLTAVTSEDFENLSNEMSANFLHNSMMGASKMGEIFGVQAGIVLAQTASPKINGIAERTSSSSLPKLYNAGFMAALGIPFGLSGELVYTPKIGAGGVDLQTMSLGLKWNFNEVIPVLPINLALRGVYSTSKLSFSQDLSGVRTDVTNDNTTSGLQILVSPMIPLIEPYAGIGFLSASNKLSASGSTSVFSSTYSTSQSETRKVTTTQLLLGVEASLFLVKLGAEYSRAFATDRYGLKLSFGF